MAEINITQKDDIYTKKVEAVPTPEKQIGIDTQDLFQKDIADAILSSELDISQIEKFTSISQSRDILYAQIDNMCEDGVISAVIEDYAQDSTEYNQSGHVMWAESNDQDIANYINFLLDNLNVDKNAFKWAYCLCKYGDVYLRLVHKSEYDGDIFADRRAEEEKNKSLQEDVKFIAYPKKDQYALYVEMQPNPAEIFELTQYDKTSGYIRTHVADTGLATANTSNGWYDPTRATSYRFDVNKDVELFAATEFVHGCLESGLTRTREKVDLFISGEDENEGQDYSYTVKRGQSVLYDIYKTWRALSLLENSILLARLTQSALTRVINVEFGDTPKEEVPIKLQRVKQLLEQKEAINTNQSFAEYTNPGPIVNNVYMATRGGVGAITSSTIGGDFDPKQLTDLEYYRDKLFGELRVPKQLYGYTGDAAGFDSGKSIAEMSAKYAKFIKRIQNVIVQMITDLINIILLSKGLSSYVNKFQLKMTPPASTEEENRAQIFESKINKISSIMDVIGLEEESSRLKVLKALLSNVIENQEVLEVIQDEIEKAEESGEEASKEDFGGNIGGGFEGEETNYDIPSPSETGIDDFMDMGSEESEEEEAEEVFDYSDGIILQEEGAEEEEKSLPSADDIGVDLLNMGV